MITPVRNDREVHTQRVAFPLRKIPCAGASPSRPSPKTFRFTSGWNSPRTSPPGTTSRPQLVAVVASKADPTARGLALLKWGLVPDWYNDSKPGPINARRDGRGSATFSDSFRNRRCIIPASGFYEWVRRESCSCDCLTVGDQTCRPIGSTLRGRRPGNGTSKSPRTMNPSAVRPPHRPRGACGPASTTAGRG